MSRIRMQYPAIIDGCDATPDKVISIVLQIYPSRKPIASVMARKLSEYIKAHRDEISETAKQKLIAMLMDKKEKPAELLAVLMQNSGKNELPAGIQGASEKKPSVDEKAAAQVKAELEQMFVLGSDMPVSVWKDRLRADEVFRDVACLLVWQAGGARLVIKDGACAGIDGNELIPVEPVSLAHPVELDAEEILFWRRRLADRNIKQPFTQMWEPVVLKNGLLGGEVRTVVSAGEPYEMNARYEGYQLPLFFMSVLKKQGWRFVARNRWDVNKWKSAEIEVVNVITPAGILYECKPDRKIEKLTASRDTNLKLGMFYPFGGTRLRTLNHVAAKIEGYLLKQFAVGGNTEFMLPHLLGAGKARIRELHHFCPEGCELSGILEKLLARGDKIC